MPPPPGAPPPPNLVEMPVAPTPTTTTTVPACATGCFALGNTTACGGFSSLPCLCHSTVFLASVQQCWNAVCLGDDFHLARSYAETLCESVAGTRLTTITSDGLPAVATNSYLAPLVYNHAVWDIQAIMSSVCSLILLFALALGFISCRNQARRAAQQAAASAWSGVTSGGSKHATHGSMSRPPAAHFTQHSRARSRGGGGQDESFVGMESFFLPSRPFGGPLPAPVGSGSTKKKFTNRMTQEEWEMAERDGAGDGDDRETGESFGVGVGRSRRDVQWEDEARGRERDEQGSDDHETDYDEPPLSAASRFTNRLSARTQAAADRASLASSSLSHADVFVAQRVNPSSPRPGHSPPPSAASTGTGFDGHSHGHGNDSLGIAARDQHQLTLWDNDSALESDFAAGNAFLAERRRSAIDKGKGKGREWE
ncbi:uncharacterized protein LOC62_07G009126 [Vanrija pseudolonga]|uniref:CFEM domain-containing protein n=1 Tax=Vanrija pseudolonga TaxID=143232 RepID=A0AAF0YJ65_9TREE|nr:hypothetical protein LOC62_07G009126 [Vanrija pseudolonga]